MSANKITAAHIRAAIVRQYCQPVWAILFEVGDATGARHTRFADAIAMSLWPSRGLELHGFEIKVSRHDWLKEKNTPTKAETIAAYCDRWWLVTCPGVVANVSEIPPAWGWLECAGNPDLIKGTAPALHQLKPADKTDAKPIDRTFLAALLRRADKMDSAALEAELERRNADREARFQELVDNAVENRMHHRDDLKRDVEAFEAASGIKINDGWLHPSDEIGRAVKALLKTGVLSSYSGLAAQADAMRKAADKIEEGLAEMGVEAAPQTVDKITRRRRRVA